MNTIITISKGQYLKDILPEIPTNSILYKKITGCGATCAEIKAKRHSIIIEPNVPVIVGKCEKHKEDNLFGVYEGIYRNDVIKYLYRIKQGEYIKLMSTPESFQKIKEAFKETGMSIYDCFLLFDECHKIIKDAGYREDIAAPFDDFFHFPEKALVSATPVPFSDPRFDRHHFKTIEIVPNYDTVKEINLYPTNNVLETIKRAICQFSMTGNRPICLFINSTDTIYSIMEQLNITQESTVFCSPKSVERLREKKFSQAFPEWERQRMKKYNFFTSRFYCALDIEMEEQPDVIILSDARSTDYTMIDPYTDTIQIMGRFRNGIHSISHIANFNNNLTINNREELKEKLLFMENLYDRLRKMYEYATSKIHRQVLHDILRSMPFYQFLDNKGRKNYNKMDNYVEENIMQSYYYSKETLLSAYGKSPAFFPLVFDSFMYCRTNCEKLKLENKRTSMKKRRKAIIEQLELLGTCETEIEREQKNNLRQVDAFMVDAYDLLGKEVLEQLDYSLKKIREAMILKRHEMQIAGNEFQLLIKNTFEPKRRYSRTFIKKEFVRVYDLLKILPRKSITACLIKDFFEVKECLTGKKGKQERGFLIIRAKI